MSAQIIDGKKIAERFRADLATKVALCPKQPKLAVILAGNDEASKIYVRNKKKAAEEIGMACEVFNFPEDVEENEIIALLGKLNEDASVHGIIVQLPLPKHLNEHRILESVKTEKDVDAFKQFMSGALWQNNAPWASATPRGVMYLLKTVTSDLSGKYAVVIGCSNIVGKPMAAMLLNEECTVTMTHIKTQNLPEILRMADIVISACGCPKLIKKDWIKKGAIVLDVGITRVDGRLCGDVDFDEVKEVAGFITPVPGGVGPMTIVMLLQNTYDACLKQMASL